MKGVEIKLVKTSLAILMFSYFIVSKELAILSAFPLMLFLFPSKMWVKAKKFHISPPKHVGDEFSVTAEFEVYGFGFVEISYSVDEIAEDIARNKVKGFVPFFRRLTLNYNGRIKKRGVFNLGIFEIIAENPFFLNERKEIIDLMKEVEVRIKVRKVKKLKSRRIIARETIPDVDRSKIGPPGTDFREIRDYQYGDPVKFINWKATARKNSLMVNEYEVEAKRTVWLIVNTTKDLYTNNSYLDSVLTLSASLAYYYARNGHKIGLTLTGSGVTLYPDYGRKQFVKILKILNNAELQSKSPLSSFFENKKLMSYYKPYIIYITSPFDELKIKKELIKNGFEHVVIVSDVQYNKNDLAREIENIARIDKISRGSLEERRLLNR